MAVTDQQTGTTPTRDTGAGTLSLGLLLLRLFVGLAMAAHGAQKLFGVFGGAGIEGTAQFFDQAGFSPGTPLAVLAGSVELGGGLLIALGLALPLAAGAVAANMVGAYLVIQTGTDGNFFTGTGGPELELFYIVAAVALILTGPGRLAVRVPALDGLRMRLLGLASAIAGGLVAVVLFYV
jgi:putative oxidoreductase